MKDFYQSKGMSRIIKNYIFLLYSKKTVTFVNLSEADIKMLITKSKEIFMKQPVFLELDSPIAIMGKHIKL